jgi:hypothetical protein
MAVRSCFAFLPARPGRIRVCDCSIIAIRPNNRTEIIANSLPAWRGRADNGWGLWMEDHGLFTLLATAHRRIFRNDHPITFRATREDAIAFKGFALWAC